jgi:hypothetical protein
LRTVALAMALQAAAGAQAQGSCPTGWRSVARCAEIAAAEALLARGDAAGATLAYERLAAREHAVDIEIGIVRSQVQAGEFRRALAFAAHTAGAHGNDASGAVFYARLLELSGQADFAEQVRAQARSRGNDLVDVPTPLPAGPYAHGDAPDPQAALVATGVLVDAGRRALVPAAAVTSAARIWVRDGLGRTVAARVRGERLAPELAELDLAEPLGPPTDAAVAAGRDAFPGAPAGVVSYAADRNAAAAWPRLEIGFIGMPDATDARPRLNVDSPDTLHGGPVFDLTGRLVGLALAVAGGERRMVPVSAWRAAPATASAPAPARLTPDALYERALAATLQVLVQR